ncbi:MAG TPA: GGDEF domain-containing protein [Solirubrobacteraceae bacterium]|jgi:diguanylate cyclase (GGDEF)-like protein|nr:GGDEF domain-containing protein [Solirubrobacteraceae bacterium]
MTTAPSDAIGLAPARRPWAAVLASGALLLLLGTLAVAILLSQGSARSQVRDSLGLRSRVSAGFVASSLTEQAVRELRAAERFLSSPRVDERNLEIVTTTLGSGASVLLDGAGRVLSAFPATRSLRGALLAPTYAGLTGAERGRVSTAGPIRSPVTGLASTAVTVPFATSGGRRVLSADYSAANLGLDALVDSTISYSQHRVYLVDASERIVAASPRTGAVTLAQADLTLARASANADEGSVGDARMPSTFSSSAVPGTPWRLLIEVPDSKLYASIAGWRQYVPWFVFALVTVLGALLMLLFARSLADRARLSSLSARMRRTAQTDSLTGLHNRRALTEQLTRAGAHARRHEEPLSVMMIDLDRFKQTNDTFGHDAGDQVLCTVADCLRDVLRTEDIYGRWGGDEFLVALAGADGEGARVTAERLRGAAAAVGLDAIGLSDGVALSIGVATGIYESPVELVREADAALYRAKADGRRERVLTPR